MKFCPNCGMPLESEIKCQCGYDITSGEVDEVIFEKHKEKINHLYDLQKDVKLVNNLPNNNQKIFNKENDFITDSSEILKRLEELKK